MRMMGVATRLANMVKATNMPTVICCCITAWAPNQSTAADTSLPIRPTASCAPVARVWVRKLAET